MCDDDRPETCSACQFETEELEAYFSAPGGPAWLCRLCAGTHAGTAVQWPSVPRTAADALFATSYVGHVVLKAVAGLRQEVADLRQELAAARGGGC